MLFPVRTPERRGPARLRCNLYHERLLIQSRLITAAVGAPSEDVRALRSRLDFVLSHTLSPAHLARLEPQRLSVFINSSGNGTHEFSFLGESSFKQHASLDVALVQDAIGGARRALRRVSWGTDGEWRTSDPDCYAAPRSSPDFQRDLITLAAAGYQLYDKLADSLAGGAEKSRELADLMRKPGTVQISTKETARLVVPAALIYDKPLDTQATTLSVCNEFLKALDSRTPLLDSPCLNGDCPNWKDVEIVCPGGFWGYRHSIALPVSLSDPLAGDVPAEIVYTDAPALTVVVSLDEKLSERPAHEQRLKDLRVPLGWNWIGDRKQALKQLGTVAAQVVYFYCHGGLSKNVPYLLVGSGANDYITPDNIRAYGIRWAKPRPLVFLNGCKTTAVEPEIALEFVTSFISRANAAGVIGTEITVFEPLATTFAETFLRLFLVDSLTLGESVRRARLALLASSNPLGLVYIPFALGGLRLAAEG